MKLQESRTEDILFAALDMASPEERCRVARGVCGGDVDLCWRWGSIRAMRPTLPGRGAVVLEARDARTHGSKLRYEPEPHKDTLGYWIDAADWAEWTFTAPRAGTFEVVVLQGCGKESGGAEVEVEVAGRTLRWTVEETGLFQRFVPRTIGTVRLESPGPHTLAVRARTKPGPAVMDLRRVVLRAVPVAERKKGIGRGRGSGRGRGKR